MTKSLIYENYNVETGEKESFKNLKLVKKADILCLNRDKYKNINKHILKNYQPKLIWKTDSKPNIPNCITSFAEEKNLKINAYYTNNLRDSFYRLKDKNGKIIRDYYGTKRYFTNEFAVESYTEYKYIAGKLVSLEEFGFNGEKDAIIQSTNVQYNKDSYSLVSKSISCEVSKENLYNSEYKLIAQVYSITDSEGNKSFQKFDRKGKLIDFQ